MIVGRSDLAKAGDVATFGRVALMVTGHQRSRKGIRAVCTCSGCGKVVPAVEPTLQELRRWLERHVALFADHGGGA